MGNARERMYFCDVFFYAFAFLVFMKLGDSIMQLGLQLSGSSLVRGSNVPVFFSGVEAVQIPPGFIKLNFINYF